MHGPIGANVSNPLQRVYCDSFFCRSRAVTSFTQVRPSTWSQACAARHAMRAPADHDAQLGLVIDAADAGRQQDRLARADDRRRTA